jgi:flavodoxin I
MKKVGIFYGSNTGNTEAIAKKIQEILGKDQVDTFDIALSDPQKLNDYSNVIFGISTWGEGDYQDDWAGFIYVCDRADLYGKVIALYGLGDQETYPESFASALGRLFNRLKTKGCKIIGSWPTKDYSFKYSKAQQKDHFVGLVVDEDVQSDKTDQRVKQWINMIKDEFI